MFFMCRIYEFEPEEAKKERAFLLRHLTLEENIFDSNGKGK